MTHYQGRHRAQVTVRRRARSGVIPAVTLSGMAVGTAAWSGMSWPAVDATAPQQTPRAAAAVAEQPTEHDAALRARTAALQTQAKRTQSRPAPPAPPVRLDPPVTAKTLIVQAFSATPPDTQWRCPVAGCQAPLTSGFGARVSPGGIGSTDHLGNDYAVPVGTALRAMHTGRVVAVGWYGGFGLRVEIDHGDGSQVIFGHLSAIHVAVGQRVAAGQVVGMSGSTGRSTGPHLHLEVHRSGRAIDPAPWLRARGL